VSKTVPGGYYIGTDGRPHDAHGKPLKEQKSAPKKAPAKKASKSE